MNYVTLVSTADTETGFNIITKIEEKEEDKERKVDSIIKNAVVFSNEAEKHSSGNGIVSISKELYYNYFTMNEELNLKKMTRQINAFDQQIFTLDKLYEVLSKVLLFTYRKDFTAIKIPDSQKKTTDDSGWGCMIRACQMMVGKGMIERTLKTSASKLSIEKIKEEVLYYFYDNPIPVEEIIDKEHFSYLFQMIREIGKKDKKYEGIAKIYSPFSLHNICLDGKEVGKYTSNIRVLSSMFDINRAFFGEKNNFYICEGEIIMKEILNIFSKELEPFDSEYNTYFDKRKINGKEYGFKNPGLIFINLRLGLQDIEEEYIQIVFEFFKIIRNNIGFVSGRQNKAYYFIGFRNKRLLYLDPHYVQEAVKPNTKIESYTVKHIYLMNPRDLSSALTLGVVINNFTDLLNFFSDIKKLSKECSNFLQIQNCL